MDYKEKKKIQKKLLKYIIPSVTSMWVFTIYSMVDGMFVANGVGSNALAAVNICMPFINFAFAIGILFAVGTSTRASIYRGEGNTEESNRIFTISNVTVFVLALLITIIVYFNIDFFVVLLGADFQTYQYVKDYLSIILLVLPCYITSYNLEVLTKADGYPQKALFTACMCACINLGLDYVFVFIFNWGIKGAAYATAIAQISSLFVYLPHFFSKQSYFKFVRVKWSFNEVIKTVKLGIADCTNEFSMAVITFLFNNALVFISGSGAVAIYTIISYVTQLTYNTMIGINQGMQPLTSYYYGKGVKGAPNYLLKLTILCSLATGIFAFLICMIFPNLIVNAFIDPLKEPLLFRQGIDAFRIYAFCFIPLGIVLSLDAYFTALEKPKAAMIISLSRGFFFVFIALVVLSFLFGEVGIWFTMTISEVAALILALCLYKLNFKNFTKKG